jgi:hypothetical protein
VAVIDLRGERLHLVLNRQGGQADAKATILQRRWSAEHRHDAVTGELVHRAVVSLDHHRAAARDVGHDLAESFRPDSCGDVHRVHNIGEQHRHLLVLGVLAGLRDQGTARITKFSARPRLGAAKCDTWSCDLPPPSVPELPGAPG